MRGRAQAALGLMFLLGFCVPNAQARKWTDKSGKYSIDAEFVGLTDGQVTLKRSDGRTIRLALENLSKADQEQVRQLASSIPKAKTDLRFRRHVQPPKRLLLPRNLIPPRPRRSPSRKSARRLKDFEAVNGRCGQDTPEMVRLILGKAITLTNFEQCTSVEQAVAAIKKVFPGTSWSFIGRSMASPLAECQSSTVHHLQR